MSEPVMYDKLKWDVATGLDYSGICARARSKYTHHDIPPYSRILNLFLSAISKVVEMQPRL